MKTNNAILELQPYWTGTTWAFDDHRVGLIEEPFVLGADQMITEVLKAKRANMDSVKQGFRMQFSSNRFPQSDITIQFVREEAGGAWYTVCDSTHESMQLLVDSKFQGWLCPAMYHYFASAPAHIYMRAEV